MTEDEWLATSDPAPMLMFLRGKVSDRKLRLLGCACCRSLWPELEREASREAVLVAELFADGEATDEQRSEAFEEAGYATEVTRSSGERAYFVAVAAEDSCERDCDWHGLTSYLPGEKQKGILTCIFGNPFRPVALNPSWLTSTVTSLAQAIYEKRLLPSGHFDNQRMGILADALEEAGCDNADILHHCRQSGDHMRGCWVVDLLLVKE